MSGVKSRKVLVSGAAGFLGSHMCDKLLVEGAEVIALDNFITGHARNLAHLEGKPGFLFIEHDITKPIDVGPVDFVINMASPASPKDYLEFPIETLDVGSLGTRNMLEIAAKYDAKFLTTSTSECYGDPQVHPQVETYWGNVNPVGPRSCYDESKRFSEAITMAYHRSRGVKTSIARIFNTYGPRMKLNDGRVVPAFVDQALRGIPITLFGDGSQTRSFCYVSDLIDGLYRLLLSTEVYPVNVGNPNEITIREFAEVITRLTNTAGTVVYQPLPEDDPKQRKPDITKARTLLGWEPKVDLHTGLLETIQYFQALANATS